MERLFNLFKGQQIKHPKYSGVVCGYDDSRFILAVETHDDKGIFFRRLRKDDNVFIMDEYKDSKYRYVYEDEREIIKQSENVRQSN
jgi:hypothetical protein